VINTLILAAVLAVPPSAPSTPVAAAGEGQLVLYVHTLRGCPPCQELKRTTLTDRRVKDYLEGRGIEFKEVSAVPTTRLFPTSRLVRVADGEEHPVGQPLVGYRGPEGYIRWLRGLASPAPKED
jgi:hypothetical protein